jgi:hypothetical protein
MDGLIDGYVYMGGWMGIREWMVGLGLKFNPHTNLKTSALVRFMEELHPRPAGLLVGLRGMPVPKP